MSVKPLTFKESMSKNVQAIMPQEDEKLVFEKNLVQFLENIQAKYDESEEYQKNIISDFLKVLLPKNFINTSKRIDLAIYSGQDSSSSIGVIIETKRLNNLNEMLNVAHL